MMNVIVCVDKSNGVMFNNRRQSQDRELVKKIMEISAGERLLMNEYSGRMFSEYSDVIVCDDFLLKAESGDFCFVEDGDVLLDGLEAVYVFNWNRDYPADKYFTLDLKEEGFKRIKKEDFVGSSHKKITLEIYRR